MEDLDQSGHFHRRNDIVNIFSKLPPGTISHDQIFIESQRKAVRSSAKFTTPQAKAKHLKFGSNLVFISGQAGIGKSTLSKVLIQQMLDPEISLFHADYVFFVRFRDLDYQKDIDLLQFLTASAEFISGISAENRGEILQLLQASNNAYLVMDGFDEATIDPNLQYPNCDITSITTSPIIIRNILSGHIFPKLKKIVTSRPRQLVHLPDEFSSYLYLNLLGLSEKGQEQICGDLCRKVPDRKTTIMKDINGRPDLKSLCYVPINCIMVMMSFFALSSLERKKLETLSAILVSSLEEWFLKKMKGKFQIKEMSFLAYNGFLSGQFSFTDFDLKEEKINVENTTALLTNNIKFQLLQGKAVMYFAHLMWQEFFVAVRLRLYSSAEELESVLDRLDSDKYEVVTRFLFGLCNKNTLRELLNCNIEINDLNSKSDRENCVKILKAFVIKKLEEQRDNTKGVYFSSILPILGWIREIGDDQFTRQAAACLRNEIRIIFKILPNDIPSINNILRFRDDDLALDVFIPDFVGNFSKYFYKELQTTLDKNFKIRVSHQNLKHW